MADLNVKMGVTGVAQFKNAMTQSKSAVKALDAELKLNEAQYKASGNAEEYLAKKTELLKKQIEEQEKVVQAAEKALEQMTKNGVDPADKAFQQMKTNLVQAQTQLVNMQNDLKGVGDTANTAASETKSLSSELSGIGKNVSLSSIKSGIDGITDAAASAARTMANLAKGVWDMAVESAQAVDDAATTARNYGIDTDTYLRMQAVGENTDYKADDILSAADKMYKSAQDGAVALADGWEYTLTGDRLKDFFAVTERINELAESGVISDKASAMESIFGKSFRNINEFDYESYSKAMEEATVITEEQTNSLLEFSNAVDDMSKKFETFKQTISAELGPAMTTIAEAFSGLLQKLIDWANSEEGQAAIEDLGEAIAGIITSITEDNFESIIDGAVGVIEDLAEGFRWIITNKDKVVTAFETIFGIFVGLEIASGVTTILQLINGLVSLGGAAGAASAIGGAMTYLSGLTIAAAAVTVIASNADSWLKDLWENTDNDTIKEWAGNLYKGLGYGDLEDDKLTETLQTNTAAASQGTSGAYAYNPVTGQTRTATQAEVDAQAFRSSLEGTRRTLANLDAMWEDYLSARQERSRNGSSWTLEQEQRYQQQWGGYESYRSEVQQKLFELESMEEEMGATMVDKVSTGIENGRSLLEMAGYFMAEAIANGAAQGMTLPTGSSSSTYIENLALYGTGNTYEMYKEMQRTRFELNAGYGG